MFHVGLPIPTVFSSLHIKKLQGISVLTDIYCKEKFLRRGLKDVLLYRYSNKSLGVILIPCPFSRIIVVGSSLGPKSYLVTGSWPF